MQPGMIDFTNTSRTPITFHSCTLYPPPPSMFLHRIDSCILYPPPRCKSVYYIQQLCIRLSHWGDWVASTEAEYVMCTCHYAAVVAAPPPTTRERPPGCRTVFVGGLPENVTEEILRNVFENCGNICSLRVSKKKNFCHVRFDEEYSVDKALQISCECHVVSPACVSFLHQITNDMVVLSFDYGGSIGNCQPKYT